MRAYAEQIGLDRKRRTTDASAKKYGSWGETMAMPARRTAKMPLVSIDDADPRKIAAIWRQLYRSPYLEGGRVLFPSAPSLSGTSFPISRAAGLGIEGDEKQRGKGKFPHWNPPLLRRRDGSHTNLRGQKWQGRF